MEGVELAGDVVRADGLDVGPVHPASAGAICQAHLADKKWLFQGVKNYQKKKISDNGIDQNVEKGQ